MVRIGEEAGELEKMLDRIADFYEDEVDTSIAALTSIVEPFMMIGVGAIVGVIVTSPCTWRYSSCSSSCSSGA